MADAPILIAGAGPTGLVLALWLTRLGVRVRIIDKTSEPGTTSRALAVQARTLELYGLIGLADAAVAAGVRIQRINFWVKGRHTTHIPLGDIGRGLSPHPFALVLPQDVHERLLIEQLAALGVSIERRTELLRFEQDDAGVRATIRTADGREETVATPYLAGCDGASSIVREGLGIGFPGGTYTGLFFVADVEASGPTANQQLHVDLEDSDFLLVFPMQGQNRLRLVGRVRHEPPDGHGALTFDDVRSKAMDHVRLQVTRVNWFSTYRVHHRVAQRFRDRRVFLLGDAAHIHSPVGGQGMNTGIGDAVNLAWKLAAVLKDESPAALLDTYEPERLPFAQRLVATTDRAFTVVTADGPVARIVRTRIAPRLLPLMLRLPPMRRFAFRTISQAVVTYRGSALSEGAAGAVHGGDRLPWVQMKAGGDNFTPLSPAWQVHVYGAAPRGVPEVCAELGLPVHVFAWEAAMQRAGLQQNALYLIRPDAYVALADPQPDPDRLRRWLYARVLRGRRRAGPVAV